MRKKTVKKVSDVKKNASLAAKVGFTRDLYSATMSGNRYYAYRITDESVQNMPHDVFKTFLRDTIETAKTGLLADIDKSLALLRD